MTPPLSVVPNPPPQVVEAEAPAQLETAVSVRNLPLGVLAILASIVMLRWAAPVLVPMMLMGLKITRWNGALLLGAYAIYVGYLLQIAN